MFFDLTQPAGQQQVAEDEDTIKTLPEKSKERYEQKYSSYCTWRSENGATQTTEDVFLSYLVERGKVANPATLWTDHSMLKTMIMLKENIDVKEMYKVKRFLKQNSKNYTPKKSSTLTDKECMQFLKEAPDDIYLMKKAALIIGIYGACRKCEMTDIEVEYLKFCDDYLVVTIPKTRNLTPRTFAVPNSIDGIEMAELMKRYIALRPAHTPHKRLFIFYAKGKCSTNPIGKNTFAKIPANIAQYLKLPDANLYTGLCFRRTSATLAAKVGGWKSFTSTVTNQVNVEKTDEEMNYEAHLPGSSTPPPSLQDMVMSALKTIEPREEEDFYSAEKDERISLMLSNKFSFLQEQLPLKIADSEYQAMKEIIYNDDVFKNATLRTKVHCTVCDTHLGASPIAQFDRFVHPVLNTLICESCCVFYNSGEFPKDEDGIEMYCKWCAQDGTVMCCSDCPLVFCKRCVERNFGEKVWEKIANADTWQCFKCNPRQLSKLHIMCSAVHEFTLKNIEKAMLTGDKAILEKDISICCKEDATTTNKRKHIVLDDKVDLDDIPIALRKRMKEWHNLNESLSTSGFALADKKSAPSTPTVASSSLPPFVPAFSLPLRSQPQMPVITRVEGNVGNTTNASNTNTENFTFNCVSLKSSVDKSQEVIDTLTRQCEYMREAMRIPKNDAQCAELRKRMQQALYQCSTMLLETRNDLTNSDTPAVSKTAVTSVDGAAGKNSTIIMRNNDANVVTPLPVMLQPPGSQAPILLGTLTPIIMRTTQNAINTNTAITTAGLKPVLNQMQPTNTGRFVNSNVTNNSIAMSQVGAKTVGNIVPSSMVSAATKNIYDKHVMDVKKSKADDGDPLAMSDDESDGSCSITEMDTFIDEPIMVKVEVDDSELY